MVEKRRNLNHLKISPGQSLVGPSPIERVSFCDYIQRSQVNEQTVASSLPGHLFQLTVRGVAHHDVGGRRHVITPDSAFWFNENEEVHVHVCQAPWRFFTVNFVAPALEPPPLECRVRTLPRSARRIFERLHTAWTDRDQQNAGLRALRVHEALLNLLVVFGHASENVFQGDQDVRHWWPIEAWFRRDLSQRIKLSHLVAVSGLSRATLTRASISATGMSPMRRIRHIRMSMARGLLRDSDLQIKQIAYRLGYERATDFSRDYRRHFGKPPVSDRSPRTGSG